MNSWPIITNKKTEKYLNIVSLVFALLGLIFLFGKTNWWPNFYTPRFFGAAFLVSALLIILPKSILKTADNCKGEAVSLVGLVAAVALTINMAGELYLYKLYQYGFQYDKFAHLTNSFLFLLASGFFIQKWYNYSYKKALVFAAIAVIFGGFLWEGIEFFSDLLFKTSEFGVYGQYKFSDTVFDVLLDFLGAGMGVIFLAWPSNNFLNKTNHANCPSPAGNQVIVKNQI